MGAIGITRKHRIRIWADRVVGFRGKVKPAQQRIHRIRVPCVGCAIGYLRARASAHLRWRIRRPDAAGATWWDIWNPWIYQKPTTPMLQPMPFFRPGRNSPGYCGVGEFSAKGGNATGVDFTPACDRWWRIDGEYPLNRPSTLGPRPLLPNRNP